MIFDIIVRFFKFAHHFGLGVKKFLSRLVQLLIQCSDLHFNFLDDSIDLLDTVDVRLQLLLHLGDPISSPLKLLLNALLLLLSRIVQHLHLLLH